MITNRSPSDTSNSSQVTDNTAAAAVVNGETSLVQRHAAVLHNIGCILFQCGGRDMEAMRFFQETVQIMIQTTNGTECRLNKERQREAIDYLNQLRMVKDHCLHKNDDDFELSLQTIPVAGVMVGKSSNKNTHDGQPPQSCGKSIPGLFQAASRFRFAGKNHVKNSSFALSFGTPFSIQLEGKSVAPDHLEEKRRRLNSYSDVGDASSSSSSQKPSSGNSNNNDDVLDELTMSQMSEATLFNMGLIHTQWGLLDSAVQYFQLAITVSSPKEETTPGLRNPVVLASLGNIGQIYCHQGRVEEAMSFFCDAIARGRASLILLQGDQKRSGVRTRADSNPKVAYLQVMLSRVLVNMSHALFCLCSYDEAKQSCQDALQCLAGQSLFDLEAAAIWFNLALIEEYQQHRSQAIQHYDRFLKLAHRLVGPDHPNVADALFRKGCVYYDAGQLQKALPPLLAALSIQTKSSTENQITLAENYHQIGKVLQAREEFDDAMSALSKALELQRKISLECIKKGTFCEVCLEMSETLLNLGRLHHTRGDLTASMNAYREVLAISQRMFGTNHLQTARLRVIIANLELELGHVSLSMSNFEHAARIELQHDQPLTTVKVKNPWVRVRFSHHPCASTA